MPKKATRLLSKQAKIVATALKEGRISVDEAEDLISLLEFEMRRRDILAWGAYYFPDKFSLPFCYELHEYLCDIADKPKTVTLAPRGHAKTTIKCFLIPLYYALNYPKKYRHFLNLQSTSTKSVGVNLSIRLELETNEKLIADYGDMKTADEKWTERQFVLKNGVVFSGIGAGESVRGINYRNVRPDYVIADDLYDDDCIENPNMVRKINTWFWSSIYKCVANDRPVSFQIQGTAINREDLMHSLSNKEGWVFRKFTAVKDWDRGIVLWVENPHNTIEKQAQDKADMGSINYAREMENEVRDEATAIIKRRDIQYYDGRQLLTKSEALDIQRKERLPETPEYVVWCRGAVDPAEKTKEINDFTGLVAAYKSSLENYYIFAAENYKKTFHENKTFIVEWAKRLRLDRLIIETNKGQALHDEIQRTTGIPLEGKAETKDKLTRKRAQSAKFENHKVFISMLIPEPIRNELIEQLTINVPPHDDLSDALMNVLETDDRGGLFIG